MHSDASARWASKWKEIYMQAEKNMQAATAINAEWIYTRSPGN